MPTKEIQKYSIYMFSSREVIGTSAFVARIYIYGPPGNTYRGRLDFYPDGVTLPDAQFDAATERFILRYNLCQFHALVDMLRNEKPIFVTYNAPTSAFIRCGLEPVGEEETGP